MTWKWFCTKSWYWNISLKMTENLNIIVRQVSSNSSTWDKTMNSWKNVLIIMNRSPGFAFANIQYFTYPFHAINIRNVQNFKSLQECWCWNIFFNQLIALSKECKDLARFMVSNLCWLVQCRSINYTFENGWELIWHHALMHSANFEYSKNHLFCI